MEVGSPRFLTLEPFFLGTCSQIQKNFFSLHRQIKKGFEQQNPLNGKNIPPGFAGL
jgi:hypothetical protein